MPRRKNQSSASLGIRLDNPCHHFTPGDDVTGHVYRRDHAVGTNAHVTIMFTGEVWKEEDRTEHRGNIHSNNAWGITRTGIHRSVNTLFQTAQTLYSGSVYMPAGRREQKWPFAFTIPTRANGPLTGRRGFTAPTALKGQKQPLPPSYVLAVGDSVEAAVEYVLDAKVTFESNGKSYRHQALLLLNIVPYLARLPLTDHKLKTWYFERTVKTQRLLPHMHDAELTWRQRMTRLVRPNKVPSLACKVEVQAPGVIQLENHHPIPFRVCVVPVMGPDSGSSTQLGSVPQRAKLTRIRISVYSVTSIKVSDRDDSGTLAATVIIDIAVIEHMVGKFSSDTSDKSSAIEIPCGQDVVAMDIGTLIGLKIGHRAKGEYPAGPERQGGVLATVYPTIATWYLALKHKLAWEIALEICGEKFDIGATDDVVILPPPRLQQGLS